VTGLEHSKVQLGLVRGEETPAGLHVAAHEGVVAPQMLAIRAEICGSAFSKASESGMLPDLNRAWRRFSL
jgi:hypothetical protein